MWLPADAKSLRRSEIIVAFKEVAIRVWPGIERILKLAAAGLTANSEQTNTEQEKRVTGFFF